MLKLSSVKTKDRVVGGELEDVLRDGASIRQLALAFKRDVNTIRAKLNAAGVNPSGERGGFPVFTIYDAAPYLHKLASADGKQIDEGNKNYWAAKEAKLDYEERVGKLISTHVVHEGVAALFNLIRSEALLIRDAVEREVELTASQRQVVLRYIDLLLENANKSVVKNFPQQLKEEVDVEADDEL